MMRFKKSALALFACLALGAITANAAQAEGTGWTIGTTENQTTAGTLIPNGTHERISCKKHGTSSLVFTGSLLPLVPVRFTVQAIDCLERQGSTNAATIDNTTSPNHSEVVLTMTSTELTEPANCSVGSEKTSNLLTDTVIMDPTAGSTTVFDKFFTHNAEAGSFFTLEFSGALCPIAENSASVKGTLCGEMVHTTAGGTGYDPNNTGTLTKVQTLLFGAAQQTTANCKLTFAGRTAQITGAVDFELSGANAGKPFGAD
ncbi:MAG TPA: hypothetical protein VJL81_02455 [Solirubrobacterales bacterium]|nr:hypothetical protein [Solirubrobacterales bacterium]